jgi:hypothetical protein
MVECLKRGLIWRGLVHDLSKFLPDEFFPYMNWFYGKYGVSYGENQDEDNKHKKCSDNFDIAWLKHQHRNKHHYQHWFLKNDRGSEIYIEMPNKYKKEMLCDWIGADKAIHGKNDIKKWWNKTKDKKQMNKNTFKWIEKEIGEME